LRFVTGWNIKANITIIMPSSPCAVKLILLGIVLALWGAPSAPSQDRKLSGMEVFHSQVTEEMLLGDVSFLSGEECSGRAMGSGGGRKAAEWIADRFEGMGLDAPEGGFLVPFRSGDGIEGANVVGILHCAGAVRSGYLFVIAHYDGLGVLSGNLYPGADSDASGVAAMLGTAKMLSAAAKYGKKYRRDVVFVATDGKYLSMAGSEALWKALKDVGMRDAKRGEAITADKVSLVADIDQVGCTASPITKGNLDYLIMLSSPESSYHRNVLSSTNERYGLGMEVGFDYYGSDSFTEMFFRHASETSVFLRGGCQAVLFTSGITMNNNKVRDTADTIDPAVMKKRTCLIFHWLDKVL